MNVEQALLNRLRTEQAAYAVQALKHPNTRDAFEYGYRTGVFAGYEHAVAALLAVLDEAKNGRDDL